jgi:thiol:disulfide interchange protein DsbA
MKKLGLLLVLIILIPLNLLAADTFVEGKDYKLLKTKPDAAQANTVVEFFNPGCPACFHAEPSVEAWLKTKPKSVQFSRVPLAFHDEWKIYSEAYYVAVGLGIQDKIVPLLFDSIHVKQKPLSTVKDMVALFVQVTKYKPAQIQATFNSVSVSADLEQAKSLMAQYQIMELPTMLVSGKYIVSGSMAKSPERTMQVVNYLLELNKG